MEDSLNEEVLCRMHFALDAIGVEKHGRVAAVSKMTGYSSGACSEFLSGKKKLSDRFLNAFIQGYGINPYWLMKDEGEIFLVRAIEKHISEKAIEKLFENAAIKEALSELQKMTESEQWRAVAVLKDSANKNPAIEAAVEQLKKMGSVEQWLVVQELIEKNAVYAAGKKLVDTTE